MESLWVSYPEEMLVLSRNVSSTLRWQKGQSEQSLSTDTPGKHRMTWSVRRAEASEESGVEGEGREELRQMVEDVRRKPQQALSQSSQRNKECSEQRLWIKAQARPGSLQSSPLAPPWPLPSHVLIPGSPAWSRRLSTPRVACYKKT